MRIITLLGDMDSQGGWISSDSGIADTATIFNPLCTGLTAKGARVLLIDANTVPLLCQGSHLVLRAQHGFLKSLLRGVLCQDALSQFSRSPHGTCRSCLHLLRAISSEVGQGGASSQPCSWPWPDKPVNRLKRLLKDLHDKNFYDDVIIDARCAVRTIRRAAVYSSHLTLTIANGSFSARPWAGLLRAQSAEQTSLPMIQAPRFKNGLNSNWLKTPANSMSWVFDHVPQQIQDPALATNGWLDERDDVALMNGPDADSCQRSLAKKDVLELPDVLLDARPTNSDPSTSMMSWLSNCSHWLELVRTDAKNHLPCRARVWMPTSYPLASEARLEVFVAVFPGRRTASESARSANTIWNSGPETEAVCTSSLLGMNLPPVAGLTQNV